MKRYMKVEWHHSHAEEPTLLFSEVEAGYETRKVEIYRDGRADYADGNVATGTTMLGEGLMPTVEDISSDPQFSPEVITKEEFEEIWRRAVK